MDVVQVSNNLDISVPDIISDYQKLRLQIAHCLPTTQIALTHTPNQQSEIDQLYCNIGTQKNKNTCINQTIINDLIRGTATEDLILQINSLKYRACVITRIRFMTQLAKTCLSYHKDHEKFRLHVPLITNSGSMFIVDDYVYRMPELGSLYAITTNKLHTALNASFEDRVHIVFDTRP